MSSIAVYGLGKLGAPLASVLSRAHIVVGVDPIEPPKTFIEPNVDLDKVMYSPTPVTSEVSFIVVPTPSLPDGAFDDQYVDQVLASIAEINNTNHVAVIVSTVMPGTCGKLQQKYLGLNIVYNPTFIAIGTVVRDLVAPDMLLIGGLNNWATKRVEHIWHKVFTSGDLSVITQPHYASYTEIELLKLSVNAVLGMKIAMANMLGRLFGAHGVQRSAVQLLGYDPRLGWGYWQPGSPISGPCLPRDNAALRKLCWDVGISPRLPEATIASDEDYRLRWFLKITTPRPKSVGILGMSYKYGTDVTEGSFGIWLSERLGALGIEWVGYDEMITKDSLNLALACEVVVICHRELRKYTSEIETQHIVDIWA